MSSVVPSWVNIYGALALFLYQTLDAIDGKQARRLGCSSPLGEIFDHGCDALALVLLIINVGCSTQASLDTLHFKMAIWCLFICLYATHWTYYVTGSFVFTLINVTEGQITVMVVHLLCAFVDPEFIHAKVYNNMSIFGICITIMFAVNISAIPFYLISIFTRGKGKNGSSVANTSVITPILPFFCVYAVWLYIDIYSPGNLLFHHPVEMLLNIGLVMATLSIKLLLSTIAEAPFPLSDITLLNLIVLGVVVRFGSTIMEIVGLYTVLVLMICYFSGFFIKVCTFLSSILDIPIISLPEQRVEQN